MESRLLSVLLALACVLQAFAADKQLPPKPVPGATDHFEVPYLPERIVPQGPWQNTWVTMDIHVPTKAQGPLPCIVFVHGGGWASGDKRDIKLELKTRAIHEGFVVVGLNYLLRGPSLEGIFPQVWFDYKNAIRFLRANAEKYHIDPTRMAAWGFSAGGWASGDAGFVTADDLYTMPRTDAEADWSLRREGSQQFKIPLDDLDPPHADHSSRLNAIVADFWTNIDRYSADDPAVLTYVGAGATHKLIARSRQVGNPGVQLELTEPHFKGKASLHVPPLTSPCRSLDGSGESSLIDEDFAWLKQQLVTAPRMTPPEARPNLRVFASTTAVRLVGAGPKVAIRYTTDGSDPTEHSPLYEQPFTLAKTTAVKAIALQEGFTPSAIATFTFTKGTPPPTITGPDQLPPATVGKPYTVTFTSDAKAPRWNLAGHVMADVKMHAKGFSDAQLGLRLDPTTGELAGTPTQPGAWTVQIQVAHGLGAITATQDFVLTVLPAAKN